MYHFSTTLSTLSKWIIGTLLITLAVAISYWLTIEQKKPEKLAQHEKVQGRFQHEFDMTHSWKTNTIPSESLYEAQLYTQKRLKKKEKDAIPNIQWDERGPTNVAGRTRAILIDASDATGNTIFAGGVGGGLWKSTDGGSSWSKINDLFDNIAIGAIAQNPNNHNHIYFGTGEAFDASSSQKGGGIWKSTDGGASFSRIPTTAPGKSFPNGAFGYVSDMLVTSNGTLIATTRANYYCNHGGILISSDQGASWSRFNGPGGDCSGYFYATSIDMANDGTIYATLGLTKSGGIYKSVNNGSSWTKIYSSQSNERRMRVAVSPSNSNIVYAVVENTANGGTPKVLKTSNGGSEWFYMPTPQWNEDQRNCTTLSDDWTRDQDWYDLAVDIDPNDPQTVSIGGIDLFRSTNGGLTWTQLSSWFGGCNFPYVHADQHRIVYHSSSIAYFGNDGGVYKSTNMDAVKPSFTFKGEGYNVTQFYAADASATAGSNKYIAGAQDNGTQVFRSPGINNTMEVTGGDGAFCHIDQTNDNVQISSYVYSAYRLTNNNWLSHNRYTFGSRKGRFINPTDYDDASKNLYACSSNGYYLRWNINNGNSYDDVSVSNLSGRLTSVRVSPNVANRIYIGTYDGKVIRVDNAHSGTSKTGQVIFDKLHNQGVISCIEIQDGNENNIVVTSSSYGATSVYATNTGNNTNPTWVNVEGNLPDMPVRWALYHPDSGDKIFLATELGVWSTTDLSGSSTDWDPTNVGLANTRIDMIKLRKSDKQMIVATHGRGLYTSDSFGAPPCSISQITAGTQTACNSSENTYTQEITVTYANPPSSGKLKVNDQEFDITSSPQTITMTKLPADGQSVSVAVSFTDGNCNMTESNLYNAPGACAFLSCTTYSSSDLPKSISAGNAPITVLSMISIPDEVSIHDVNIKNLEGTHAYIRDMKFSIKSPANTSVVLVNRACNSQDNFDVNFDDEAASGTLPCSYNNNGTYRPQESLSAFDYEQANGTWTLQAEDLGNGDGGELTKWEIEICSYQTSDCAINNITLGNQSPCTPGATTYSQQLIFDYENPPSSGQIDINGQLYDIPQGLPIVEIPLPRDGQPVDIVAKFTADEDCSWSRTGMFTTPLPCVVPCDITDVTAGTHTDCDESSNTYTQQVVVTYSGAPSSGQLTVNGQNFAITSSPQTVTLVGLPANGDAVNVVASFTENTGCSFTKNEVFLAPRPCQSTECNITNVQSIGQSACDPSTNTYTQTLRIFYDNPPSTGQLSVNDQLFNITGSPQEVTLTNLPANGSTNGASVEFTDNTNCALSVQLWAAPESCAPTCSIDNITARAQTACDPNTNKYTQEVIVSYSHVPNGDSLNVNGKWHTITSSPQSITLTDLTADGQAVNVTAHTSDSNCTLTKNALFSAPEDCTPSCSIASLSAGAQSACDSENNKYTQEVIVTHSHAPSSGTLVVNGQNFSIGSSPQTVLLTNLTADGQDVNVNAYFSTDGECMKAQNALFSAPTACNSTSCITYTSTDVPKTIPDNSTVLSSITVAASNTISDVNVKNITGTHDWRSDLEFKLIGPDATEVSLLDFGCSEGTSFDLSFDDEHTGATPNCVENYVATLKPSGNLSDYNNKSSNGTWQLSISDTDELLAGELTAWAIEICSNAAPQCAITAIESVSNTACAPATNTYTQDVRITYANAAGDLVVNGQTFTPTGSPQVVTLSNLTADGHPVDVVASFSENANCTYSVDDLFTAQVDCTPPCSFDNITVNEVSACDPSTNTYSVSLRLTYSHQPSTGVITINGQNFPIEGSGQDVTLTGLTADHGYVDVIGHFSAAPSCSLSKGTLFRAPEDCTPQCAIIDIALDTLLPCDPNTNKYDVVIKTTHAYAPSGSININGQSFVVKTSPQLDTLKGLTADGNSVNITAAFANNASCSLTETNVYTAPSDCTPQCEISAIELVTLGSCDPSDNEYTADIRVTYANAPESGSLIVNGQSYAITTSPQTVQLTGLSANGQSVDVMASFSTNSTCTLASSDLYTAPTDCTPSCAISDIAAGDQTACDPSDNTYSQEIIVTYANAPSSGGLVVNGQTFAISGSPDTVVLTGLNADGLAKSVTASFSAETDCQLNENNVYTSPANCTPSCEITAITAGTQIACDPETNTYEQDIQITYANPPSGDIDVNGQLFAITSSPQTVRLTNLAADGSSVNVIARFSSQPTCTLEVTSLFSAADDCTPPCSITAIVADSSSTCDDNNQYKQYITVTYANPPMAGGKLKVNDQEFTITASPQQVVLQGLTADGNTVDITASFTAEESCSMSIDELYTAPASCSDKSCVVYMATDLPMTIADVASTISSEIIIDTNVIISDLNVLGISGIHSYLGDLSMRLMAPDNSVINLLSNLCGNEKDFDISFDDQGNSATPPCPYSDGMSYTPAEPLSTFIGKSAMGKWTLLVEDNVDMDGGELTNWSIEICTETAPNCSITAITASEVGTCDESTNTYNQVLTVSYENAPTVTTLVVNDQEFSITENPQDITLMNLPADGQPVTISAHFLSTPDCDYTAAQLYTAPAPCMVSCSITDLVVGDQIPCDENNNLYDQEIRVRYSSPPSSGKLSVAGQLFDITSDTAQTVNLSGLTSDGQPVDVTAFFTATALCSRTEQDLFMAPESCLSDECTTYVFQGNTLSISDDEPNSVMASITVPDQGMIDVVRLYNIQGTHSYAGDLVLTLMSPTGDNVQLTESNVDCSDAGFSMGFDDQSAEELSCALNVNTIYQPYESLSALSGKQMQGEWRLRVDDAYTGDGGTFDTWSLQICQESVVVSNCDDTEVNGESIEAGTYRSATTISSSGRVPAGADVIFKAQQEVILQNGFEVQKPGTLTIQIENCEENNE